MAEKLIFNLERIRINIGEISGSFSDLQKFKEFKGYNDSLPDVDGFDNSTTYTSYPNLIGTYTITDYITQELLSQLRSIFPNLTINASNIIYWDELAVQTLDPEKPNYNPAFAILCYNKGYGTTTTALDSNGTYLLTKAQAAVITLPKGIFSNASSAYLSVSDSKLIVNKVQSSYSLKKLNQCVYFKYASNLTLTSNNSPWYDNRMFDSLYLHENISVLNQYSCQNCKFTTLRIFRLEPALTSADSSAKDRPTTILVGNGENKHYDNYIKELYFKTSNWSSVISKLKTWYDYAAPQISWDNNIVTMTTQRTSDIYYTLDGTKPTVDSDKYTEPFEWSGEGIIKAMAIDEDWEICYAEDFYNQTVDRPIIALSGTNIIITGELGSTIYYTLDGTYPLPTTSPVYDGPIDVSELGEDIIKVRCFATKEGYNDSEVVSKILVVDDSLYGTDGDSSYFTVQCMDSTKPNYNPAVCIILDNNSKLTDKLYGAGGYLTKTGASSITSIDTWFKSKTSVADSQGLVSSNKLTYDLETFNEFKYFNNIASTSESAFYGCTNIQELYVPYSVTSNGKNAYSNMPKLSLFNTSTLTGSNVNDYVSSTQVRTGNDLGTVIVHRNASFSGSGYGNTGVTLHFLKILVYGNFSRSGTSAGAGLLTNSILRIKGSLNNASTGTYFKDNTQRKFLEIMTDIQNAGTNIGKFTVVHLGMNNLVSKSASSIGMGNIGIIYVGNGSSRQNDEDVLALYLADTNWATYSAKLATWYDYNGEYKWYYVTDNLTNCTNTNPDEWPHITRGESYQTTIVPDDGMTLDSVTVEMYEAVDDGVTPNTPTDITSSVYDSSTGEINIPAVTGNIIITATAS